jgi:hypothetical protein
MDDNTKRMELRKKYGKIDTAFEIAFAKFKKSICYVSTAMDLGYEMGSVETKIRLKKELLEEFDKMLNTIPSSDLNFRDGYEVIKRVFRN